MLTFFDIDPGSCDKGFVSSNDCIDNKEDDVLEFINYVYNSGYSLVNQIYSIHNLIIESKKIPSDIKSDLIIMLGNIDQNLIKGCDELIQLYRLAYFIMYQKSNLKN